MLSASHSVVRLYGLLYQMFSDVCGEVFIIAMAAYIDLACIVCPCFLVRFNYVITPAFHYFNPVYEGTVTKKKKRF